MTSTAKVTHGITLLELMIALATISILAVIAYPNYREHVERAGRSEAISLLLEIAANQQRFYLTARRFGSLTELGYAVPLNSVNGDYILSMPIHTTTGFVATATYNRHGNERARCASFSIDHLGERSSLGTHADCWSGRR